MKRILLAILLMSGFSSALFSMTDVDEESVPGHIVQTLIMAPDQQPVTSLFATEIQGLNLEPMGHMFYTVAERAALYRGFLYHRFGIPITVDMIITLSSGMLFGLTGNKIFIATAVGASLWRTIALMGPIVKHLTQQ